MTVEELLKPRYKVIADYPLSKSYFEVGAILIWDTEEKSYRTGKYICMHKTTVESYPHLFKKLEWWEERSKEEMPKYVKSICTSITNKVLKFDVENKQVYLKNLNGIFSDIKLFVPATEEEYNNQILNPQTII